MAGPVERVWLENSYHVATLDNDADEITARVLAFVGRRPAVTDDKLTRQDAAYVARLARIDLTEEELDLYAGQLAAVLDHAAQVAALDTTGVEPTAHPLPLKNVLRRRRAAPVARPRRGARPGAGGGGQPLPGAEDPGGRTVTTALALAEQVRAGALSGRRGRRAPSGRHRRDRRRGPRLPHRPPRRRRAARRPRSTTPWPPARTRGRWPACPWP